MVGCNDFVAHGNRGLCKRKSYLSIEIRDLKTTHGGLYISLFIHDEMLSVLSIIYLINRSYINNLFYYK